MVAGSVASVLAIVAAAASPASDTLTLDAALARAEAASPLIRRALAEQAAAAARDVGASQIFPANPLLSVGAGPRHEDFPGGGAQQGVQYFLHAEQEVEIGGQRGARRAAVDRGLRAAAFRVEVARAETRARVRAVYVAAQLAQARVDAAAAREALVNQLLDAVAARVASGASSEVDLQVARLERGIAARARMDAALVAVDASARLRLLLGLAPGTPLHLEPAPALPPPRQGDLPALVERAQAARAELAALSAQRSQVDAELASLHRQAVPSPTLFVDLERDLPGQLFVGGGVAVPIPMWRRQEGPLALVHAEGARLDQELELAERDVGLEVERAFAAEAAERRIARLLEAEVLPAADGQSGRPRTTSTAWARRSKPRSRRRSRRLSWASPSPSRTGSINCWPAHTPTW